MRHLLLLRACEQEAVRQLWRERGLAAAPGDVRVRQLQGAEGGRRGGHADPRLHLPPVVTEWERHVAPHSRTDKRAVSRRRLERRGGGDGRRMGGSDGRADRAPDGIATTCNASAAAQQGSTAGADRARRRSSPYILYF